uniref:Cell wall-associated hydrolase n=1 Tax=Phlebotomus kandelakii TaxID=1109342 RepID=A0A6B2EMQ0_9DIPT
MPSAVIPSVHSYAALPLARQQLHQRYVHPGPLVLGTNPLKTPTPTADRDRTVSRRSEPSSRTTLIGEQPNPWDLLQPQDVMSRHRGAKRPRRYGLLGVISLLSPAYLLSVERWPTHAGPPDHYDRLSSLLEMSLSQSSGLMPLHATSDFRPL